MTNKKIILVMALITIFIGTLFAQEEDYADFGSGLAGDNPFFDLSMESLLEVKLNIGSKKAITTAETPGIVTVISNEQILGSGASDLLDLLTLLVPSINFGADVEGAVGIGIRGFWSHEGKVLLMIDGQECNEEMFATTVFGNHYPVEIIERVEMIRGPGSSIYGGYAAVGVINIITKNTDSGTWISAGLEQMKDGDGVRRVAFGTGKKSDDWSYSITGVKSNSQRSDRDNIDVNGDSLTMDGNSDIDTTMLNLNVTFKGLDVRLIADQYRITQIDLWGENYAAGADEDWDSYFLDIKYDVQLGDNFVITPEFKYKKQYPWQLDTPDQEYTNEKDTRKSYYIVSGLWDISKDISLTFGGEYTENYIYQPSSAGPFEESFTTGSSKLGYDNIALYAQLMFMNDIVNTTIGGRYDDSDEFGDSFVPRIGFTKNWGVVNTKLMISESFRLPGGILRNRIPEGYPEMEAETAENLEFQIGYNITKQQNIILSIFKTEFSDVIVYAPDTVTGVGSYFNLGETGSQGFELEYKFIGDRFTVDANYGYYEITDNTVSSYDVASDKDAFLGMPQNRANLLVGVKVTDSLSIHPSLSYYGERYAYNYDNGAYGLNELDASTVVNVNFLMFDAFVDGLTLNFGVKNLFDEDYDYVQPYDGGHAPLPSASRTIYVRASKKI